MEHAEAVVQTTETMDGIAGRLPRIIDARVDRPVVAKLNGIDAEFIDITRHCFPREPIQVSTAFHARGPMRLKAGASMIWKVENGMAYYLRNRHFRRTLRIEVI